MTEQSRFEALRARLGELHGLSPALARQIGDVDLGELRGPGDLALIPVLRKSAICRATGRRTAVRRPRDGADPCVSATVRFAWRHL